MLGKRRRSNSDSRDGSPCRDEGARALEANSNSGLPIPSFYIVTPWLAHEISSQLPPLPGLHASLEREVFTHPGLGKPNYERLEWLGDSYIEQIATCLISQTFVSLPSGRCSQIREQLVRNKTLAKYFRDYGMSSRARLPSGLRDRTELGRGSSRDKDLLKTQGDMFEAYVAGVVLSDPRNGLKNASEWLKALWGSTISDQIKKAEKDRDSVYPATSVGGHAEAGQGTAQLPPKERLAQAIYVKGVRLRYEDLPCHRKDANLGLPLYSVGAYLDGWGETGKLLGRGTALGKKEAGHKAAAAALENKQLLRPYISKKAAFTKAREAAATEAAAGAMAEAEAETDVASR